MLQDPSILHGISSKCRTFRHEGLCGSQMVLVGCMTSTVSYCIRHLSNKMYVRLPHGIRSILFREFHLLTGLWIKWWKDIVDGQHTGYSQPDQVVSKESTRAYSVTILIYQKKREDNDENAHTASRTRIEFSSGPHHLCPGQGLKVSRCPRNDQGKSGRGQDSIVHRATFVYM